MKHTSPDAHAWAFDSTNNFHNPVLPSVCCPKGCGTICDLTTTDFEATSKLSC